MGREQGEVVAAGPRAGTELWEAGCHSPAGGAAGLVALRDGCFGVREMLFMWN